MKPLRAGCVHELIADGEAIKVGGNGVMEQYRTRYACRWCDGGFHGAWQMRRIEAPPVHHHSKEALKEMRDSLYEPE